MATIKVVTGTDLGPGDGGKGGVIHRISSYFGAHTILKVGGAQGSHGVHTSSGENFAFSTFGCGTLEGVLTHVTPCFVAHPEGLLHEGDALSKVHGINNVFDMITIDERVLFATPYHGIASRLKELVLKDKPRGTIGTGVGEAYRYLQHYPDLAIRAKDLSSLDIHDRLADVREQVRVNLAEVIAGEFLPDDKEIVERELKLLEDYKFIQYIADRFREVARRVKIVDGGYLGREILSRDGVVVVESSHGILTDNLHGFHPHTSAIRTLPCFTHAMLDEAGYTGQVVNLGIFRAYTIRHGAGPMPTADESMNNRLLPGSHKDSNRYQGKVRTGPLDLTLLRYAIEVAGGPIAFDGLAVTWFDQMQANGEWQISPRYAGQLEPNFFNPKGDIRVRRGSGEAQLKYQAELGQQLQSCRPEVTTYPIESGASRDELYDLCASVLEPNLGVRVRMLSLGPTERDKILR